jgi:glycosyltransferase involved in cell wall biosynthesis
VKVCVVSLYPPTVAGVADYGAHLSRALAARAGVSSLTVLADRTPGGCAHERQEKLEIRRIWRQGRPGIGPALVGAIRREKPDVVWFNQGLTMFGTSYPAAVSGLMAPLAARLLGLRTVLTLHEVPAVADLDGLGLGGGARRAGANLAVRLALQADEVIVTLDRYRRTLERRYRARNVRHIPHGAWEAPRRLPDLPEGDRERVLVLGTFGPHKDPGLVADAVARLRVRRPGLRLQIAGADHPRYPGFLDRWKRSSGLGAEVEWLGYVPAERLADAFAQASVVVLPAVAASGSSGVVHRAAGFGRPVLISDLPDYRALASEEGFEFAWFAPGDVGALAVSLESLLDDPGRRAAMVACNLQTLSRLTPEATAAAYLEAFAGGPQVRWLDELGEGIGTAVPQAAGMTE